MQLPQGFLAAGVHAGISKKKNKPDCAIFYSEKICNWAGVFTTNRVQAAPVVLSQSRLRRGIAQAIVVNSGCANACTGKKGYLDAQTMCEATAKNLSLKTDNVLVASTGVIGKFLPMNKVKAGIRQLASIILSPKGYNSQSTLSAVHAIMTTDTVSKISCKQFKTKGGSYSIWACAKGAGMIHPNMATMLSFILTDAGLSTMSMKKMLKVAADRSFNSLSIDGDTSTNDSVFFLSNGVSGLFLKARQELEKLQEGLNRVCEDLAKQIALDGEGATKRVELLVKGARAKSEAKKVAETIATSPLIKTALFGGDPNWGRIMAAIGRAGVDLNPSKIDISFDGLCVAKKGCAVRFSEKKAQAILNKKIVPLVINLNQGQFSTRYFSCDFSPDYVKINSDYRT